MSKKKEIKEVKEIKERVAEKKKSYPLAMFKDSDKKFASCEAIEQILIKHGWR